MDHACHGSYSVGTSAVTKQPYLAAWTVVLHDAHVRIHTSIFDVQSQRAINKVFGECASQANTIKEAHCRVGDSVVDCISALYDYPCKAVRKDLDVGDCAGHFATPSSIGADDDAVWRVHQVTCAHHRGLLILHSLVVRQEPKCRFTLKLLTLD